MTTMVTTEKYHDDLYVRDFPADQGKIPSSLTDDLSLSVDIVPTGVKVIPDFKTRLVAEYDGPFTGFENIEKGSRNFIYVRARNLADHDQEGCVFLYYLEASLALRPDKWRKNVIRSSNNFEFVRLPKVGPGKVSVADEPFAWIPPAEPGHYCLIAQVVTEKTPNPITDKTDIREFALWVANHPGIAWRNVLFVDMHKNDEEYAIRVVNPSADPLWVPLKGECIRMPDGTKVSMRIPAHGPMPPVNREIVVGPANLEKPDPKTNIIDAQTTLPGNFMGTMHVRVEFPKGTKPDRPRFNLREYAAVARDREIDAIALAPEAVFGARNAAAARFDASSMALVRLGDYFIDFR